MAKTKKLTNKQLIGRWVRILWDDCGTQDALVVDAYADEDSIKVFTLLDHNLCSVERKQIIKVGNSFTCNDTGLNAE
jgi:hypothetical protein